MTAARTVGAQGGINFAKMLQEKTSSHLCQDYEKLQQELETTSLKNSKTFALRVALTRALTSPYSSLYLLNPFRTHPTHEQRIAYLQEFLKNNPAPAAAAPAN